MLGCVVRFFHFALFDGTLLSLRYYLVDAAVCLLAALLGYRITRVRQMTTQYRWLNAPANRAQLAGALEVVRLELARIGPPRSSP